MIEIPRYKEDKEIINSSSPKNRNPLYPNSLSFDIIT